MWYVVLVNGRLETKFLSLSEMSQYDIRSLPFGDKQQAEDKLTTMLHREPVRVFVCHEALFYMLQDLVIQTA